MSDCWVCSVAVLPETYPYRLTLNLQLLSDPSWHMDHVLHLIELYEDNSVLWNHTMEEHKDLLAFEQAKQKIVDRLKKKGGTT